MKTSSSFRLFVCMYARLLGMEFSSILKVRLRCGLLAPTLFRNKVPYLTEAPPLRTPLCDRSPLNPCPQLISQCTAHYWVSSTGEFIYEKLYQLGNDIGFLRRIEMFEGWSALKDYGLRNLWVLFWSNSKVLEIGCVILMVLVIIVKKKDHSLLFPPAGIEELCVARQFLSRNICRRLAPLQ